MFSSHELLPAVFEGLIVLTGLGFIVWLFFRPAGRAFWVRPPALPHWDVSLVEVLFLAWLVLVIGLAEQLLLRVTVGPRLPRLPDGSTIELVLYGSVFHFGAIVTWVLARFYQRRRAAHQPPATPPAPRLSAAAISRAALWTFLVSVPLLTAAAFVWEPLLKVVGLPTEHQELVDFIANARSPYTLGFLATWALIVAPVAEELVLRAGLFRFLRGRTPRWVAFTVSSGLFALAHANWASFLPLFLLGWLFAAAYERTGSIAVPMLAHALFNLNSLVLVLTGVGS